MAFAASAQTDLKSRLNTTAIAAASTNTTAMAPAIGWNRDQVLVFQVTLIGTNAAASSNIVMNLDVSNDGTDWVASQHTITATAPGSGTKATIARLTNSVGGKWLRVKSIENPSAAGGSVTIKTFNYSN